MLHVNECILAINRSFFAAALVFYTRGRVIRYSKRGNL